MGSDPVKRLKYIKVVRRNGREYHYFRYKDHSFVPLRSPPGTSGYFREYASAIETAQGGVRIEKPADQNRLDMRVEGYLRSAEVLLNTKGVRSSKRRFLESLIKGHEHEHPASLTWDYIKRVRDEKFSTVPVKNEFVRYVSAFLSAMMEISVIPFNPVPPGKTARLKHTKRPRDVWREEDFRTFRAHWAIGTAQRAAFELFYNTAQRCITVTKLGPANLVAGKIVIDLDLTAKNNDPVGAKILPMTMAAINALGDTGRYFFPGKAPNMSRSEGSVSQWFSKACAAAGLPSGYTAHGIRHGVMTLLAERGFSAEQIQALTGHKSLQMILHYTKTAKRNWMTSEAVDGLGEDWDKELENRPRKMENFPGEHRL